ncbi:hypothetical protein HW132_33835 [Brasilonema sp. CT11]|nr:hypothetical protein [Brasilonema sp. CT11]
MARKSNQTTNQPAIQPTEQPKKAKTMQPEQTFKLGFTPLESKKDGTFRLTFAGYQHSISKNNNPYLRIIFSCMDVTRKNPANINILSNYNYTEKKLLGRLLKTLGYVYNQTETILDPDDEFGYEIDPNLTDIYEFLDTKRGLVFKGAMTLGEDGFYLIEVATLQPLLDKTGKQQLDYAADDGLSSEEIAIDMEVDGGDNE